MGKKRKFAEIANSGQSFSEKLELSNKEEPNIRRLLRHMMHSMGEAIVPLKSNEDFIIDILKNELIGLLNDCIEIGRFRLEDQNLQRIHLCDLIYVVHRQKLLISRFITYLRNRAETMKIVKSGALSDEEFDEVLSDDEFADESTMENKKNKRVKLSENLALLYDNIKPAFDQVGLVFEDYLDIPNKYNKSIMEMIEELDPEEYEFFSKTRQISFQKTSKLEIDTVKRTKQLPNNLTSLLTWIGSPEMDDDYACMFLAFFAKEVVMDVVSSALEEKLKEPGHFDVIGCVCKSENCPKRFQIREKHYEEAMRKKKHFRKYLRIYV